VELQNHCLAPKRERRSQQTSLQMSHNRRSPRNPPRQTPMTTKRVMMTTALMMVTTSLKRTLALEGAMSETDEQTLGDLPPSAKLVLVVLEHRWLSTLG
jgi:hypothetical protein